MYSIVKIFPIFCFAVKKKRKEIKIIFFSDKACEVQIRRLHMMTYDSNINIKKHPYP